ncbi:hypothetical protein BH23BAC1_BH23BAC1_12710 [soil metagenome]
MINKATTFKWISLEKIQVKATVLILIIACILPLSIHIIPPVQGTPIGAILLPMFYVPFIAIIFFRLHVGVTAAALAPLLNFLITGNPHWQFVFILIFELTVFTFIAYLLLKDNFKWIAAPLSYLFTKVISSCLLMLIPLVSSPVDFFLHSVSNGSLGLLILGCINLGALWYKKTKF